MTFYVCDWPLRHIPRHATSRDMVITIAQIDLLTAERSAQIEYCLERAES